VFKASLLHQVDTTVWVNIKKQGKVKTFPAESYHKATSEFYYRFSSNKQQGEKRWDYYRYRITIHSCRL